MTDQADRLVIAQDRINNYMDIDSAGGRNSAIALEVGRIARDFPTEALSIAESMEDPSLRISCLAVVGHKTKDLAPLVEARAILEGEENLNRTTRNDKLSRIALYAAGVDNRFAADTALAISSRRLRAETQDVLSLILSPIIEKAIEEDRLEDLKGYHYVVFRALGLSRHGQQIERPQVLRSYRAPSSAVLDPIRHGGRFLEAVEPQSQDFHQLLDLIESTDPAR